MLGNVVIQAEVFQENVDEDGNKDTMVCNLASNDVSVVNKERNVHYTSTATRKHLKKRSNQVPDLFIQVIVLEDRRNLENPEHNV